MATSLPSQSRTTDASPAPPFRRLLGDAIHFWEARRLVYNSVLAVVVFAWLVITWPHFRPALTLQSLLLLVVLGLIANACYCVAYLVDIPLQYSTFGAIGKGGRWAFWLLGTLLAIVLANYWIADEIYPFVR
jgi:hypothetical protein